ncbi:MAG: hypothetical protein HQ539_02840 [Parcubacteria group bacterium]|nr:hypothetical protein [Parcubacteria group bacterium]
MNEEIKNLADKLNDKGITAFFIKSDGSAIALNNSCLAVISIPLNSFGVRVQSWGNEKCINEVHNILCQN